MGLLNRIGQQIMGRAPKRNPDEEPFTFRFLTNKDGSSGEREIPVGSYNVRVNMRDKRLVNIFGINNHKTQDNIVVAEGSNDTFVIKIKHPTFGYVVQPNGRLPIEEMKRGRMGFSFKRGFKGKETDAVEQKFRVVIVLPQKTPVTRYKSFWGYLFKGKPPLPYSDFEVYLRPTDEAKGSIIKILPGKVFAPRDSVRGEFVPRLRLVDARKFARRRFWGPDTMDLKEILDIGRLFLKRWYKKGYLISAIFTNEELRDVQPMKYDIMVKISFGKVVDQHFSVGTVEFIEGHEESINLSIEKIQPENRNSIPADGVSNAQFVLDAKFKHDRGEGDLRPHGLTARVMVSGNNPLYNLDGKALKPIKGTQGVYDLNIETGKSIPFLIKSKRAIEKVTITAKMISSNQATEILTFGGYELKLLETQKTEESAGSQGKVQLRVQVIDMVTKTPINTNGMSAYVNFRVDTGTATLAQSNGRGASATTQRVPVSRGGVATIDVIPGENATTATVIATMDGLVFDPLLIPVSFKPVRLKWAGSSQEVNPLTMPASGSEDNAAQFVLKVTEDNSDQGVVGVPVNISITDFPEAGDSSPRLIPIAGRTPTGKKSQTLTIKSDKDGLVKFKLTPGLTKGKITLTANTLTGQTVSRIVTVLGIGINLVPIGGEGKGGVDLMADGNSVIGFDLTTIVGPDGKNDAQHQGNYEVTVTLSGKAAASGTNKPSDHSHAVIVDDAKGGPAGGSSSKTFTSDSRGSIQFFVRSGTTAGHLTITAKSGSKVASYNIELVHPKIKIINSFNEYGKSYIPDNNESLDVQLQGAHAYGFRRGKKYLIMAQVSAKDDSDTNLVTDGTIVKFIAQRERGIGRFSKHGTFEFVKNEEPNQVHVKTQGGIAKVEYEVETRDEKDKFVVIYARLEYTSNQDRVLIPIVLGDAELDEDAPGYDLPNLDMGFS